MRRGVTLAAACAGLALPHAAQANSAAADYFRARAARSEVPALLTQDERSYYRDLFTAIERQDWTRVQAMFAAKAEGPLHSVARAEYYLAAGSPKVELDALNAWMASGTQLPQAEQIAALAQRRGAAAMPALPSTQRLMTAPGTPKRTLPRATSDGTMPASIAAALYDRIKNDDPVAAQQLLDGIDAALSPSARAEWRQRVAWAYYIENDDAHAYAVAQTAAGGEGPWVAEGWWTAGLAAWRLGDCTGAAEAFAKTAAGADNAELAAAAHYWRARALVRCRQPELSAAALRSAALRDETLYGMLAAEQLGSALPATHAAADFTPADWQRLRDNGNVRAAVELAEIGEDGLADEILRYQARIGEAAQYPPLSRLARDLGLPQAQLWMAGNVPRGASAEPAARFPTPKWTPQGGWQVDPALIYAHTLQESVFRTAVTSPAGARGLMQIMPIAVREHAASLAMSPGSVDLARPEVNLAFGQRNLAALRDSPGTGGLLPKVMAAYNAGLTPITRWNTDIHDGGDPLLWMESIPYWETRGYVAIVLRNYWMYERQAGGTSDSRVALAQTMWPTFPGLAGGGAVRIAANGARINAH